MIFREEFDIYQKVWQFFCQYKVRFLRTCLCSGSHGRWLLTLLTTKEVHTTFSFFYFSWFFQLQRESWPATVAWRWTSHSSNSIQRSLFISLSDFANVTLALSKVFSRFFRLCYRLHFHIAEKLEDTTFKPTSSTLHFFTEALAYLLLVLPSLSSVSEFVFLLCFLAESNFFSFFVAFLQIIVHGILLNYRRQEEQLSLLLNDPSVEMPEGLFFSSHY